MHEFFHENLKLEFSSIKKTIDTIDKRIIPARGDLAAEWLFDDVVAGQYVSGLPQTVVRDGAPLYFSPNASATLESQLIYGEIFQVYEERDGWCWGQNLTDSYVGFVQAVNLATDLPPPDHQVVVLKSHLYVEPDLKSPRDGAVSISARVKVIDMFGGFSRIATGHWLYSRHLMCLENKAQSFVATAKKFIGVPYLWGGRSSEGMDCSSFVQLALAMAGVSVPRDSDLQEVAIGIEIPMGNNQDYSKLEVGDLVFFKGHVGVFIENAHFLHANAFDMQVSEHSFTDVLDRSRSENASVSSIRRLMLTT